MFAEIFFYNEWPADKQGDSRKSRDPNEYFRGHETQLILHDGAKELLQACQSAEKLQSPAL